MTRARDATAKEPLLAAMAAASHKDAAGVLAALTDAEAHLHDHHDARRDTAAVREAVAAGEWHRAWLKAYHAICALVWTFPPDRSLCPPPPSDDAVAGAAGPTVCPSCAVDLPAGARFCAMCGSPITAWQNVCASVSFVINTNGRIAMSSVMVKIPALPFAAMLQLRTIDDRAMNGWIGEALGTAGSFHYAVKRLFGDDHEVTVKTRAYVDALSREHYNTRTNTYDKKPLRDAYLAVRGAIIVALEGDTNLACERCNSDVVASARFCSACGDRIDRQNAC